METSLKVALLFLLAASGAACHNKETPVADKPAPTSSAASAVTAAPTSSAATLREIPTLVAEKFAPPGGIPTRLYPIEGALMVTEGHRVGRIAGDGVEWIGQIPKDHPALGENVLGSVHGRFPDLVGALYMSGNGRAPEPTYFPLGNKKAGSYRVAEGGGAGWINGVARLGDTIVLSTYSMMTNAVLVPVRGPKLARITTKGPQAGCKDGEVWKNGFGPEPPAISPAGLESTPDGTLVSIGKLCEKRGPAAEIWDKAGKSRIVDLSRFWKTLSYHPTLLKGPGDELFALTDRWSPILHYRNGDFEAVPSLDHPVDLLFVSPKGVLHASDGRVIHRYEGGKWIPGFLLPDGARYTTMAIDESGGLWAQGASIERLRPGPAKPAPEGCKTRFVYLYVVSEKNPKDFTFPSTRRALSSFPDIGSVSLVEIQDQGSRRLGATAPSEAVGKALVAHIKATMKDEDPRLFCYEPKGARAIDMNAKK